MVRVVFKRAETCDVCIAPAFWKFEAEDELGITEKPVRLCKEHRNMLILILLVSTGDWTDETKKRIIEELNGGVCGGNSSTG